MITIMLVSIVVFHTLPFLFCGGSSTIASLSYNFHSTAEYVLHAKTHSKQRRTLELGLKRRQTSMRQNWYFRTCVWAGDFVATNIFLWLVSGTSGQRNAMCSYNSLRHKFCSELLGTAHNRVNRSCQCWPSYTQSRRFLVLLYRSVLQAAGTCRFSTSIFRLEVYVEGFTGNINPNEQKYNDDHVLMGVFYNKTFIIF